MAEGMIDDSAKTSSRWIAQPGATLFLASFLSLFLELLIIRWVPSIVQLVAYYSNVMLISSFLGLGCGVILARRHMGLYKWFGAFLLLFILFVTTIRGITWYQGSEELRFLSRQAQRTTGAPIAVIFILNALVFLPFGELVGTYFQRMAPLRAYAWDLGGAICGTILFGFFSYNWFSPVWGFAAVMAAYLVFCQRRRDLAITGSLFFAVLVSIFVYEDKNALWSPYHHITVKRLYADGSSEPVVAAPKEISNMLDPYFYLIQVNHNF